VMTAEQKIRNVERQITACERGGNEGILCPYCGTLNALVVEEPLCCADLGIAVEAILHRKEVGDHIRKCDRIMEFASRN
jgi:hypothetical protein